MPVREPTSTRPVAPPPGSREAGKNGRGSRLHRSLTPVAGPALITAAVLVVLAPFAFEGRLTAQHVDLLPLWLPTHCFLGSQLAAGHIPAWNPFVMGGTRFAADPQSGWLYLPAMVLYATLPCGRALGWLITLQPVMAGLGLYAFLRGEGAARAAATVGGVCLALSMAASYTVVSLPFAGALAWTTVLLATGARFFRAKAWAPRLFWLLATALAWGQLAGAHMSQGMILGTAVLAAYLIARLVAEAAEGGRRARSGLGLVMLLVVALPLVNLAILLPRLNYYNHSSLTSGYRAAEVRAARLEGLSEPKAVIGETGAPRPQWPLSLATTPGAYLGVAALSLLTAGLWSRRHRPVVLALIAFAGLTYLLSLRSVAMALSPHVGGFWLGDVYLHAPARMRFGVVLAAPALAGFGADAWGERSSWLRRSLMLLPAVLVFGLLPTALGYRWNGQLIPFLGLLGGAAALGVAAIRPRALLLVPAVLAIELTANGLAGQAGAIRPSTPGSVLGRAALVRLQSPELAGSSYSRAGPIAKAIQSGGTARYMPLARAGWERSRGYLVFSDPRHWPLLANQRSMLFRIEDVGGSDNPVQSLRYWSYVRTVTTSRPLYNAAFFTPPSRSTLDLMQVKWIIQRTDHTPPVPGAVLTATEGAWDLYRLPQAPARASVVATWTTLSPEQALRRVTDPRFDPETEALLETTPRFTPSADTITGTDRRAAIFSWRGPQAAVVQVSSPRPAVLLIRNTYDPGWHATVDGEPATLQPADYVAQGVPVPAGRHVVELTYDDPTIGYGLLGSGIVIALLLGGSAVTKARGGPLGRERGGDRKRSRTKARTEINAASG